MQWVKQGAQRCRKLLAVDMHIYRTLCTDILLAVCKFHVSLRLDIAQDISQFRILCMDRHHSLHDFLCAPLARGVGERRENHCKKDLGKCYFHDHAQ